MLAVERLLIIVAISVLAVIYGFAAHRFHLFPYQPLERAFEQASTVLAQNAASTPHFMRRAVFDHHGAKVIDKSKMQPGLTLIASHWKDWDWSPGLRLVSADGRVLHEWKTDPAELWPPTAGGAFAGQSYPHGSLLFGNGDVVFNLEYTGTLMIDACGEVKWYVEHQNHHSIAMDDDGNFWVPGNVVYEHGDPEHMRYFNQFPGLYLAPGEPIWEDRILQVSAEGEILQDLALLEVIYENDLQRYLPKTAKLRNGDITHMNDVEPLGRELADEYPLFEAGDLLVSVRNLHLVMVLDPDTREVKWYSADEWIEQHDPDFIGDGWISVFDNNKNFGNRMSKMLGGSRIVAIRPHSGEFKELYTSGDGNFFYTPRGGKTQHLANGNLLLTEKDSGRVFEVTADGQLVWEWIADSNRGGNMVAEVMEGTRYDLTPQQVAQWPCSSGS